MKFLVLFNIYVILCDLRVNRTVLQAYNLDRSCHGIDIMEKNVEFLHSMLKNKILTSKQLCECYLKRTQNLNLYLNAVIEINPDLLKQCELVDQEIKVTGVKHLLHGIPILLKDNIAASRPMKTTAGSLALSNFMPIKEATLVTKLRNKGMLIFGKANLSVLSE